MTTKNKIYPKRNGREMTVKEKDIFDRLETDFKNYLSTTGVPYPESEPFNLATVAVWTIQDRNKERAAELKS